MISNFIPCHLSKPVIRDRKTQSEEDFILERKKYFEEHIRYKEALYENKPIYLVKRNIPGDACFEKFAIGKEEFHKTKTIDLRRLERFDWIFEIIDKIDTCKKCGWIQIYPDKNFDDRTDIECIVKNFKIVITIAEHQDHYEIVSAHYKRY